jgi:hypothetical protein
LQFAKVDAENNAFSGKRKYVSRIKPSLPPLFFIVGLANPKPDH